MINNMHHLQVAVHGLNMMNLQNHRVTTPNPSLDVLYSFHSIPALFSPQVQDQRLLEMVDTKTLIKRGGNHLALEGGLPWKRYEQDDVVLISQCSTYAP